MRIGMGYDVHRLAENRKMIIGGVEIPYEKGLLGHSDADVLLHAVMDALLGAAALGDIGKHFPDTDAAYEGISSLVLLEKVRDLLEENCFFVENIDATIIAQAPKMRPYIDEMRKDNPKVAEIMTNLVSEIEEDENKYKGQSILNIVENMKRDCIEKVISDFCVTWYASKEDVMYAALHYRNGEIPNESVIKATIDYQSYKSVQEKALPKFKYYAKCMAELKKTLDEEIKPLISVA